MACWNEFDTLKKVLVCEPRFLMKTKVREVSIDMALKQHRHFISTLEDLGVDVIKLPPLSQFPEQVFTRDIGFLLGENMLVSKMANYVRQGEENYFKQWLEKEAIPSQAFSQGTIEGGDVLIDGKTVFVGLSNRTNQEAVRQLKTMLPDFEIVEVPFTDSYLHLDCVFNIISPTEAIIFPEEVHGEKVQQLKRRYDLIEVTREEQATLATNVLSIGEKRVVSLPINQKLNTDLAKRGYEVIEVDITEIIKFEGSFRCCTLPLLRV